MSVSYALQDFNLNAVKPVKGDLNLGAYETTSQTNPYFIDHSNSRGEISGTAYKKQGLENAHSNLYEPQVYDSKIIGLINSEMHQIPRDNKMRAMVNKIMHHKPVKIENVVDEATRDPKLGPTVYLPVVNQDGSISTQAYVPAKAANQVIIVQPPAKNVEEVKRSKLHLFSCSSPHKDRDNKASKEIGPTVPLAESPNFKTTTGPLVYQTNSPNIIPGDISAIQQNLYLPTSRVLTGSGLTDYHLLSSPVSSEYRGGKFISTSSSFQRNSFTKFDILL